MKAINIKNSLDVQSYSFRIPNTINNKIASKIASLNNREIQIVDQSDDYVMYAITINDVTLLFYDFDDQHKIFEFFVVAKNTKYIDCTDKQSFKDDVVIFKVGGCKVLHNNATLIDCNTNKTHKYKNFNVLLDDVAKRYRDIAICKEKVLVIDCYKLKALINDANDNYEVRSVDRKGNYWKINVEIDDRQYQIVGYDIGFTKYGEDRGVVVCPINFNHVGFTDLDNNANIDPQQCPTIYGFDVCGAIINTISKDRVIIV